MPLSNAQAYPLWINAVAFLIAAVIVWIAGTRLTHYLDGIAHHNGWDHAFVGMLLLGGITSLPEVANVVTSSLAGNPRLGINNLLGSAAINVLLLAVADAWIGRDAITSVVVQPVTLMMGTLCMLVLMAVAASVATGDLLIVGSGIGIGAVILCLMSVVSIWICGGYGQRAQWTIAGRHAKPVNEDHRPTAPIAGLVFMTVVAGAVIFTAGYALSQIGDALADQTGFGAGMVGFVLIGISTSMPELSSIVTALRIRRYEMAFGQVLGTNFINLSLILIADAFFLGGPVINELSRFEILSALLGAMLIGIFMVGLLEHKNLRVIRMGYDSFAVVVLFTCGLAILSTVQ
jgi:cation:H+ antiporter